MSNRMNSATLVKASSSISRSNAASIGSLFHNFATSASVFPCNGISLGFCTAPMRKLSGPFTCCHSLFHSREGVSSSLRMRARVAGSFSRSISLRSPPSCAHGGISAEGFAYAVDVGYETVHYDLLTKINRMLNSDGGALAKAQTAQEAVS